MVRFARHFLVVAIPFTAFTFGGCKVTDSSSTTKPLTVRERQDAALKDPFGYGGNTEKVDINGGGFGELDKNAVKHDVDSVFNP